MLQAPARLAGSSSLTRTCKPPDARSQPSSSQLELFKGGARAGDASSQGRGLLVRETSSIIDLQPQSPSFLISRGRRRTAPAREGVSPLPSFATPGGKSAFPFFPMHRSLLGVLVTGTRWKVGKRCKEEPE
ncbi:hypothetical protein MTO96_019153 [Rhipicephalus appendiculatus]